MKRHNKYKIDMRSRPGIYFSSSVARANRRAETGPFGRYFMALIIFCLIPPGLFLLFQWLQFKIWGQTSILLIPQGPFLYVTAFLILLLSALTVISILKRHNYLHPLLTGVIVIFILLSQTFFTRLTPQGIFCHELFWETAYPWSDIRSAQISVTSLIGYHLLNYQVYTDDGREIALNPPRLFFSKPRDLNNADNLMTNHQVPVTVKTFSQQLPLKIEPEIKSLIGKHSSN